MGECSKILTRRNGKILTAKQKSTLTIIEGYIPVANTLGLSAQMRSSTSGRVFWQCTFDHWEKMSENAASQLIKQIRKKKGLPEEIPKPDKFVDEPEQRKTQRAK
jgi:elongation factor 2